MDDLTVCAMQANNAGTSVSGSVERRDGSLVVVVNGTPHRGPAGLLRPFAS